MHRTDDEIWNVENISVFSYISLLCRLESSATTVVFYSGVVSPNLRKHFLLPSNFLSWSLCFDERTNDDDVKYFFVQ